MVFCKFLVFFVSIVVSVCAYFGVPVVSRVSAVYTFTPVLYNSFHRPAPSLSTTWRTLLILGQPGGFYRSHRRVCLPSSLVALLLLLSGIESNPGREMHMGSLNARSVVRKGPLIQELISSHRLDALAICESWICGDDPDAIKLDSVPDGFRVMHVPRPTTTQRNRGGGLCFIHRDKLTVKQHPIQRSTQHETFECQLLSISNAAQDRPADKPLVLAKIYRQPSATIPSLFYDELSDLLTKVGDFIDADRFIMCGDFNCPGPNSTVDTELLLLFDYHGLCQYVSTPTHHTSTTNNVLDLLVGSSGADRIASVDVLPSHDVSDHDLVTWSIARQSLLPRHTIT